MYCRQMLVAVSLTSPDPLNMRRSISQCSTHPAEAPLPLSAPPENPGQADPSSPSRLPTPVDPLQLLKSFVRDEYLLLIKNKKSPSKNERRRPLWSDQFFFQEYLLRVSFNMEFRNKFNWSRDQKLETNVEGRHRQAIRVSFFCVLLASQFRCQGTRDRSSDESTKSRLRVTLLRPVRHNKNALMSTCFLFLFLKSTKPTNGALFYMESQEVITSFMQNSHDIASGFVSLVTWQTTSQGARIVDYRPTTTTTPN